MNTRTKFVGLLAVLLSLAILPACWTGSLHALYEHDDQHLTYDPALEGTWQQIGNECQTCRLLITGDSKAQQYTLQLIDLHDTKCNCGSGDGPEIKFEGRLVQLGTQRFLDAFPQGDISMGAIPAHNIFKITVEGDSLSMVAPSDDWLCDASEVEQARLGECRNRDFVLTAATELLQDFMQNHAEDEGVFPSPSEDDDWHRAGKPGDSK
jgi:hypothetical protein